MIFDLCSKSKTPLSPAVSRLRGQASVACSLHNIVLQAASQQASQPAKKKTVDATSAAGGSAETIEQRQKEARKWINDWRAR